MKSEHDSSDVTALSRRKTDKFAPETDHDLLIMHSVKIDNLCKLTKGVAKKLDTYSEKIELRCEHRYETFNTRIDKSSDDKVDENTFRWIIGIMIFAMISMVAMIGVNQVSGSKNGENIRNNGEAIIEVKSKAEKLESKMSNIRQKFILSPKNP